MKKLLIATLLFAFTQEAYAVTGSQVTVTLTVNISAALSLTVSNNAVTLLESKSIGGTSEVEDEVIDISNASTGIVTDLQLSASNFTNSNGTWNIATSGLTPALDTIVMAGLFVSAGHLVAPGTGDFVAADIISVGPKIAGDDVDGQNFVFGAAGENDGEDLSRDNVVSLRLLMQPPTASSFAVNNDMSSTLVITALAGSLH